MGCGTKQDEDEGIVVVMRACVHVNELQSHRFALGEATRPIKMPKIATQTPTSVNTASLDHPGVDLGVVGAAFATAVMSRRWNRKRCSMGIIVGCLWWGVQYTNRSRVVGLKLMLECVLLSYVCPVQEDFIY